MSTKLAEKYRLARNVDEGYEVAVRCDDHGRHWLRVVRALHVTAPLEFVSLRVEPVDGEPECSAIDGEDGDRMAMRPNDRIFSRRVAS